MELALMQTEILLGVYIVIFATLHSLTAAPFFKRAASRLVSQGLYRFLYSGFAAVTVIPLLYLWFQGRASSQLLYRISFPLTLISIGIVVLGLVLVTYSLVLTDIFSFLGLKHVLGFKDKEEGLVTSGAYGLTRHPLYLGGMLILWSNPVMRLVDFVVAFLFSLYFGVGGFLEERKLEAEFGSAYSEYKERVSMFIPIKWLRRKIGL
jgi:protein-S-isoprenylcysteine O-methyltransferase Ste14